MRIGLDARTLFTPQRRGIGKSLIRLYERLAAVHPDWQIYAYHRSPGFMPKDLPGNFVSRFIEMPGDRYDAWTQLRLPMTAWLDKVEVLHSPANACPNWMPVPTVVTLHDLIPLDLPEGRSEQDLKQFEQAVRSACSKAASVISPSKYTRKRLVKEHGLDAKRAIAVPWGVTVEQEAVDIGDVDSTLQQYDIDRKFMLHLGAPAPRKNTRGVIEAWAMVRPAYRRNWKLLIIGLDRASQASIKKLCTALGIQEQVLIHGYAKEEDLPVLLSASSALLYPSFSEGFGLPILEAFAVATPVLTSDTTSLPEVAGDAAELVPPGIPTALASAITRLMKDPMRRNELVTRGAQRLTKFRWADAADQYAEVLETAARRRCRSTYREEKRSAA